MDRKDGLVCVRVPNELRKRFKRHCEEHGTTMSNGIIQYITNLVDGIEEKPEIKMNFFCPYCGKNVTDLGVFEN